jgi:hypothetical protein
MIIQLQLFHGEYLIKVLQKKINIAKQIFIIMMEEGSEALLPKELSQE